jgi:deoxyribonuclease V
VGILEEKLESLRKIQEKISSKIIVKDSFKKPITLIAGVDLAFIQDTAIVACVTQNFPSLEVVDTKTMVVELDFPYIPTFLGFREGPAIVQLIKSLNTLPDIFFINAHGIAHPRYFGCASHVGILVEKPTIGVAANNLQNEYSQKRIDVGEAVSMYYNGRAVGWVLNSKSGCKPIFISPGHLVSLDSSLKIAKDCLKGHKFPEPLFNAHKLANEEKKRILNQPAETRTICSPSHFNSL